MKKDIDKVRYTVFLQRASTVTDNYQEGVKIGLLPDVLDKLKQQREFWRKRAEEIK
jgi:hypothetical protein